MLDAMGYQKDIAQPLWIAKPMTYWYSRPTKATKMPP